RPIGFTQRLRLLAGGLFLLASGLAGAQNWPTQPVKIVAPVPAGGGVDILSRAIAQKLQEQWNVSVVVENKPGASALIGTDYVAKATDGHTLLMGYSVLATNKFLVGKLPYDLERDLAPIVHVGYIPLILVTQPTFPANSVKELIALLKSNPGKYSYASGGAGAGAHLSGELFKHLAGVELTHVPYKGNAPALNDVLGGHVAIMFDTITTSIPHVKSGRLKALATTAEKRSPLAPDVPTMIEAGVPGFEISAWYMLFAPRSMPKDVVQKVNAAVNKAMADPELAQRLGAQGVTFVGGPVGNAETFLSSEVDRWGKVIKAANIKAE
ncbi:MAG: tripartite tricarboxylate transporter substrate binding protein, partial [Burkholderiaceae bacterium]